MADHDTSSHRTVWIERVIQSITLVIALVGAGLGISTYLDQHSSHVSLSRADLTVLDGAFIVMRDPIPRRGPVPVSVAVTTSMSNDAVRGIAVESADLLIEGRRAASSRRYIADPTLLSGDRVTLERAVTLLPLTVPDRQSTTVAFLFKLKDLTRTVPRRALEARVGVFADARLRVHLQGGHSTTIAIGSAQRYTSREPAVGAGIRCQRGRPRRIDVEALAGTDLASLVTLSVWREDRASVALSATRPWSLTDRGPASATFPLPIKPGRYVWAIMSHGRVLMADHYVTPGTKDCLP